MEFEFEKRSGSPSGFKCSSWMPITGARRVARGQFGYHGAALPGPSHTSTCCSVVRVRADSAGLYLLKIIQTSCRDFLLQPGRTDPCAEGNLSPRRWRLAADYCASLRPAGRLREQMTGLVSGQAGAAHSRCGALVFPHTELSSRPVSTRCRRSPSGSPSACWAAADPGPAASSC